MSDPVPVLIRKMTLPDGTICELNPMSILSYGNSTWQDFINVYNANAVVYCRAASGSNPASGSQTRLAFMAYVDNATTPTNVEFQYYRSVSSHSDSQQGDQVYVYKLTSAGVWSVTVREAYSKVVAGTNMSSSYSNGTITLSADLSSRIAATEKGAASGVAELDANGKVPSSQLPSYVDDVIEGYYYNDKFYEEDTHTTEITAEADKIYIDIPTNKTYRWSGSAYVAIGSDLALGETSSTAYRGDRGKTAYDHATDSNRLTTAQTAGLYKIATTSEGHVASVTAVAKSDITALGIPAQDTTYSDMTGATSSAAGTNGLVPAPSSGDNTKFLRGDGTWAEGGGGLETLIISTSITNASGQYTNTISDSRITSDMIAYDIAYGTPSVIKDDVEVECDNGEITISCDNAVGTTTVTLYIMGCTSLTVAEGVSY